MVLIVNAVILAATEFGGMGSEYFERRTRHLIPVAGKPFISHLIDILDDEPRIGSKYIVIEEKISGSSKIKPCEDRFKEYFKDRINNDIILFGQNPLTKVGTFEAFKECVTEHMHDHLFPIILLYGDCLVKKEFLSRIIDEYFTQEVAEHKEKPEAQTEGTETPRIIWGVVDVGGKGDIIVRSESKKGRFQCVSGNNIREILEFQIETHSNNDIHANNDIFLDTGIMIINRSAWDEMEYLVKIFHRPSSEGIFSFTNILRQALIINGIILKLPSPVSSKNKFGIEITCLIGMEDDWTGADYPWQLLEMNKLIISNQAKNKSFKRENITNIMGQSIWLSQTEPPLILDNGSILIGPCILEKDVTIQPFSIIKGSFIGSGSVIESNSNIIDSTICDNSTIRSGVSIENCIIMKNTVINCNCAINRCIIGESVMLGMGVMAPCQRLMEDNKGSKVIYFSDTKVLKTECFGAIVGDSCKIGSGTIIHPGRRIGKSSKITSHIDILNNLPPYTIIK